MKFRVSESELERTERQSLVKERQRKVLKELALAKRKRPNSCVVFICDEPRTHFLVRVNYYSDGSAHRIPFCFAHATALAAYWRKERKIDCVVESIGGHDVNDK